MNFMFEWQELYLTSERSERVRYSSCHVNHNMITDRIGLHSVLLPLLIACNTVVLILRKPLSLRLANPKSIQPSFHGETKKKCYEINCKLLAKRSFREQNIIRVIIN